MNILGEVFNSKVYLWLTDQRNESVHLLQDLSLIARAPFSTQDYIFIFQLGNKAPYTAIGPKFKFNNPIKTLHKIKECVERVKYDW